MAYEQADFLQLSGLQHFHFCRRQWALIHIEAQWAENYRTIDGALLHKNAHNPAFREQRGGVLIRRGMRVFSAALGVSGDCDVLELCPDPNGIALAGQAGLWQPYPVEYKRGKPNPQAGDTLQLCGQAMCLEEMLCCTIPAGALYYGETHHRMHVAFTEELRCAVRDRLAEMHALYRRGHTPKVRPTKACNACSLKELCLPALLRRVPVQAYLSEAIQKQAEDAP